MKANRMIPLLIGLLFCLAGCNEELGGKDTIKDYAIDEYYETDSISFEHYSNDTNIGRIKFRKSKTHRQSDANSRYTELSRYYGDHIDTRLFYEVCRPFVDIVSVQVLQADTSAHTQTDVSKYYQLTYGNPYNFVTMSPRMRQDPKIPTRKPLTACDEAVCKWAFQEIYSGSHVQFIGGEKAIRPDSTTTIVLTLKSGERLSALWFPKDSAR